MNRSPALLLSTWKKTDSIRETARRLGLTYDETRREIIAAALRGECAYQVRQMPRYNVSIKRRALRLAKRLGSRRAAALALDLPVRTVTRW